MRQFSINYELKTDRKIAGVNEYLADIVKYDLLSIEREVELSKLIREGNNEALQELVSANLRFVVSVAKKYQHRGLGIMDLINEGNMGMIKAAGRYDETRGFKFISFAVWWIRQSIMVAIAENSKTIRRNTAMENLTLKVDQKKHNYFTEFGEYPSDEYIYDEIGLTELEIKRVKIAINNRNTPSINCKNRSHDSDAEMSNFMEQTIMPKSDYLTNKTDNDIIINSALSKLDVNEKEVVIYYYGFFGVDTLSLENIGNKLNLTCERARQIHNKALNKLRKNKSIKELIC